MIYSSKLKIWKEKINIVSFEDSVRNSQLMQFKTQHLKEHSLFQEIVDIQNLWIG